MKYCVMFLIAASACIDSGELVVNRERLDLGKVECGTRTRQTFSIANPGIEQTSFSVESSFPGLQVEPRSGVLGVGESLDVILDAGPPLNTTVGGITTGELWIHGEGDDFTLPITVESSGVGFDSTVFDFGEVTPGVLVTRARRQRCGRSSRHGSDRGDRRPLVHADTGSARGVRVHCA